MIAPLEQTLAIRINSGNLNHHLFDNNGTWWCHYTVHRPDFTKHRIRTSLHTRNVCVARRRRDIVLVCSREKPRLWRGKPDSTVKEQA